jgi:hypothetical protein
MGKNTHKIFLNIAAFEMSANQTDAQNEHSDEGYFVIKGKLCGDRQEKVSFRSKGIRMQSEYHGQ